MSELDTTINNEENIDQENTVPEVETETQEGSDSAEGKKIGAIIKRKNDKIAELEAKLQAGEEVETGTKAVPQTGLSRDEAILIVQGLTGEEVDKASKIAKIENVTLNEAVKNDIFIAWKKTNDTKAKSSKASISVSAGSPKAKEVKDFNTPDLSSEDHQALFKNRNK